MSPRLKWLIRQHSSDLIKEGALLKIAKHWTVHADRFDASTLRIGQEMAQKLVAVA